MKSRSIALAAACALPLAALAATQSRSFKDVDTNHDNYVSRQEAQGAPQAKDFDKLDKNHDGKLSVEEYALQKPPVRPGSARAKGYGKSPGGSGQAGPAAEGRLPR